MRCVCGCHDIADEGQHCTFCSEQHEVIKPLKNHRGVKLSQTKEGQRELIREMRNKMNEIIEFINTL